MIRKNLTYLQLQTIICLLAATARALVVLLILCNAFVSLGNVPYSTFTFLKKKKNLGRAPDLMGTMIW